MFDLMVITFATSARVVQNLSCILNGTVSSMLGAQHYKAGVSDQVRHKPAFTDTEVG